MKQRAAFQKRETEAWRCWRGRHQAKSVMRWWGKGIIPPCFLLFWVRPSAICSNHGMMSVSLWPSWKCCSAWVSAVSDNLQLCLPSEIVHGCPCFLGVWNLSEEDSQSPKMSKASTVTTHVVKLTQKAVKVSLCCAPCEIKALLQFCFRI